MNFFLLPFEKLWPDRDDLVAALAGQCAAAPEKVIDLLTGYLWDAEEAVRLKETAALSGTRS